MAGGGLTGRNNFRKMYTANSKKSKYAAILETPEQLREKELKAMDEAQKAAQPQKGAMAEVTKKSAKTTVDELTKMTETKLRVSKRNKKATEDVDMDAKAMPKISLKSKGIKKQAKKLKASGLFGAR